MVNPTPETLMNLQTDITSFEQFINGAPGNKVTTRLGAEYDDLPTFFARLGYEPPVAYAAGLSIVRATQTVDESGARYAPKPSSLPIDPTPAAFNGSDWYLVQDPARRTLLSLYDDFQDAVANVGMYGEIRIDANEVLPAATITVPQGVKLIAEGGILTLQAGTTLNINGQIDAIEQFLDATVGTVNIRNENIDIRWFGAVVGQNSAAAIQAAANAASSDKQAVIIPEDNNGFLVEAEIQLQNKTHFRGNHPENCVLKASATLARMFFLNAANRIQIRGIKFDGNGQQVTDLIDNRGSNNVIENCIFTNASAGLGNVKAGATTGITVNAINYNLEGTTIRDNVFEDIGSGIRLVNGPWNVTILNNLIHKYGVRGIFSNGANRRTKNLVINGNRFKEPLAGGVQSKQPIAVQASDFGNDNVTCINNKIIGENLPYRNPLSTAGTDPANFPAASERQYVDFTVAGTVNGQAVNAGEHWVALRDTTGGIAADWELATASIPDAISFHDVDGLLVENNYVFGGGEIGINASINCKNVLISNNFLYSCDTFGVNVGNTTSLCENIMISDNMIYDCSRDQAEDHTNIAGIGVQFSNDVIVTDNKIVSTRTGNQQMPYALFFNTVTNADEQDNYSEGWATLRILEQGAVVWNTEQAIDLTPANLIWQANKDAEIVLTDASKKLLVPEGLRPGLKPIIKILGGHAIDVSDFTVRKGIYDHNVNSATLNQAKIFTDSTGTAYLEWENGVVTMDNVTRPSAVGINNGEFFFNSDDEEFNVAYNGQWYHMDAGVT